MVLNGSIYGIIMSKIQKQLEKMHNNPQNWRIEDLQVIANRLGLSYRQMGTSHMTFRSQLGIKLTVPVRKPIKPIYIKLFLELIETLGEIE